MLRNDMLSLPDNWEAVLEQMMLIAPGGGGLGRVYICSPCRADSAGGVIRNMKAARIYMFYAYTHFAGMPRAPHAYLPTLLNDNIESERDLALRMGIQLLKGCGLMLVCGNKLSGGMLGEINAAADLGIPIEVFNKKAYDSIAAHLKREGMDPSLITYNAGHLHFALAMGADELAPYWDNSRDSLDCFKPETDTPYPLCDEKNCTISKKCQLSAYMDEEPFCPEGKPKILPAFAPAV